MIIQPSSSSASSANSGQYTMLLYNSDNKPRLSLMRTCIALLPRFMPLFKENELVEILSRLTLHIDDELKALAFNALRTFVIDYPLWRRYVFTGFTTLILREISENHVKLIDASLKMLLQLINAWKLALSTKESSTSENVAITQNPQLLEDTCQVLFHLEGFAVFNLSHAHVQRRRYALILLRECKYIGEQTRCYQRMYARHVYALDALDVAAVHALKRMHMQCFNSPVQTRPDLHYLIEQSSTWETSVNTANYNYNGDASYFSNATAQGSSGGGSSMPNAGNNSSGSSSIPVFSQLNSSHAISTAANLLANPVQTTTNVLSNIIQNAASQHLNLSKMRTSSLSTYYSSNNAANNSNSQQPVITQQPQSQPPLTPASTSSSLGKFTF
jgi:hypothetical protein